MLPARSELARLHVLGGCRLLTADGGDATPRSAKGRALLACVALAREGAADRGQIAALLWSESETAKVSLRQSIKEIRAALARAGLPIFSADKYTIRLDLGVVWVDALEVARLARSSGPGALEAMVALYVGDLLENLPVRDPEFEDWLLVERARLREKVCQALERAVRRALNSHDADGLKRATAALLALEPAHEEAHRALMCWHGWRGEVGAAIRQYQACRTAMQRDLALPPSAETEAVLQELREGALRRASARSPPSAAALRNRRSPRAVIVVEPKLLTLGDLADQSLAAALAASLREALSRNRWLSVVDAGLYFPAGQGEPSRLPRRELSEPSYCVYVSVLRARDQVRLGAELKEAGTNRVLWADRYDTSIENDVFVLVDRIAGTLAGRLDQEVRLAEIMRASREPVEALSAYDCVLRAIPLIFRTTVESFAEADQLLLQAQEADPHDSMVYAWRSFWYSIDIGQSWARDLDAAKAELEFLVRRSIELDPKNAFALSVAGHIAAYVNHDYEHALGLFERSLRLNPNSAYALDSNAVTLCYAGRADEALRLLEGARPLWQQHPDPYYFQTSVCIALLLAGRPEEAAEVGRTTVRENPNFQAAYRPLVASLGLLGRVEEADGYLASLRRLHPDFSLGWFRASYPPLRGEAGDQYIEGLRRAGVPK